MTLIHSKRLLLGLAIGISVPAMAQESFPTRPVKIIVPLSAGSDTDLVARVIGEAMGKELKQPVVVDNKPGAGGMIGMQAVVQAVPDGYTIGMGYQAVLGVIPHLKIKAPYDPRRDLTAIGRLATTSNAIIVANDSPLKTMSDLVAQARKQPGAVNYASWGVGSGGHLAGVLINLQAKVQLEHVPYKGTPDVVQAVLSKDVQVGVVGYGMATTQLKGGKVRVLALLGEERSSYFPGVPTASETGYPIVQAGWFGLVAPAGLSPAVAEKLEAALLRAAKDPAVAARLATLSITVSPLTGKGLAQQIEKDYEAMGVLVGAAGIVKD